jgi:hypothetical protein
MYAVENVIIKFDSELVYRQMGLAGGNSRDGHQFLHVDAQGNVYTGDHRGNVKRSQLDEGAVASERMCMVLEAGLTGSTVHVDCGATPRPTSYNYTAGTRLWWNAKTSRFEQHRESANARYAGYAIEKNKIVVG